MNNNSNAFRVGNETIFLINILNTMYNDNLRQINNLTETLTNLNNSNSYNVGNFSCRVPNTFLIFVMKFIYIVFWTYILNLICKDGHIGISWLLVLLPWIMLFVIMGMLMLNM